MTTKSLSITITAIFLVFLTVFSVFPLLMLVLTAVSGVPSSIFSLGHLSLTLHYFLEVFTSYEFITSIKDTVMLSAAVVATTFVLSLPAAYAFSRTPIPLKGLMRTLLGLGIAIPGFLVAFVLITLSTVVKILGFSIYSFQGLLIVLTLADLPFMVMYVTLAFDNVDYRLLEAAYANGVSRVKTFFRVLLPLLMPGFINGWVIVFLLSTGTLSVPLLLAPPTFPIVTEYAYVQLFAFYNWGAATALLTVLLIINTVVIIAYVMYEKKIVFSTIGGKGFHIRPVRNRLVIAVLFLYTLIISLLPIVEIVVLGLAAFASRWPGTLIPTAFTLNNFATVFSLYPRAAFTSVGLSVSASIFAIIISFISTYYVKIGLIKGKRYIDAITMIIFSLSPVMIGMAYLTTFSNPVTSFMISATPLALILGYTFGRIGYSSRAMEISVGSISNNLFYAANIMGKDNVSTLRKITLPLITPGVIEGFLLVFIRSMIDYGTTIMLLPTGWSTLVLGAYEFVSTGEIFVGSAMGFIILAIDAPIMAYLYYRRGKTFHEVLFI